MKTKICDLNGNDLITVSVKGSLMLYAANRMPYTGPVMIKTECENGSDPCTVNNSSCPDCNCYGLDPELKTIETIRLKDYKDENGYYNIDAISTALNANDRFPPGRCPGQKAVIMCSDAEIWYKWSEVDLWAIVSVIEPEHIQLFQ